MAQMIYANPFGAAAEGAQRGLDNVLKLGQAGRQFRDSDQQAEFRKWYDPFVQKQMQQKYDVDAEAAQMQRLQNQARLGSYTGNYSPFDQSVTNFYGAPQGTRTPQQQQLAADIFSGVMPGALAYPDVTQAGGVGRKAPLSPQEMEMLKTENQIRQQYLLNLQDQYRNPQYQQQSTLALPQYDFLDSFYPTGGVQTSPTQQPMMPRMTNNEGDFYKNPQQANNQQDIFDENYLRNAYSMDY